MGTYMIAFLNLLIQSEELGSSENNINKGKIINIPININPIVSPYANQIHKENKIIIGAMGL
jgi:hypothetical protein